MGVGGSSGLRSSTHKAETGRSSANPGAAWSWTQGRRQQARTQARGGITTRSENPGDHLRLDSGLSSQGRFSSGRISSHLDFFFQLLPQLILNTGKEKKKLIIRAAMCPSPSSKSHKSTTSHSPSTPHPFPYQCIIFKTQRSQS